MNVTVLSAGTWGISLATLLHGKGETVRVWEHSAEVVAAIVQSRRHPKLPDVRVPEEMAVSGDLAGALADSEVIVCAVPAAHLRETCERVAQSGTYRGQLFIVGTKGIEHGTHALMHQVAEQALGEAAAGRVALLSGPSHAEEVSRGMPTAVSVACTDAEAAARAQALFMTPRFRVYTQPDVVGVALGSSLKNIIAIACGTSDGLGFGDNAKAGLITRGLSEILRLGTAMGARPETFSGLTGIGDLVVTCMSQHSRNWRFGYLLGQGRPPDTALAEVGMVVEGYYTVRAALELAGERGVEMPISQAVAAVVFQGMKPMEAVTGLMLRDPKSEQSH